MMTLDELKRLAEVMGQEQMQLPAPKQPRKNW